MNHHLFKCDQFAELDHKGRIDSVNNNNIWINCLSYGHKLCQCKYESFCQAVGCKKKHNRLLHHEGSVVNNSVDNRHTLNVFMPIVDALVNGILKIRCLIDTGSTSSFIPQKNCLRFTNVLCAC